MIINSSIRDLGAIFLLRETRTDARLEKQTLNVRHTARRRSATPTRRAYVTHFFTHGVIEGAEAATFPFSLRRRGACAFCGRYVARQMGHDEKVPAPRHRSCSFPPLPAFRWEKPPGEKKVVSRAARLRDPLEVDGKMKGQWLDWFFRQCPPWNFIFERYRTWKY